MADEPTAIRHPKRDDGPTVYAPWLLPFACHGIAPSRDGFCGGLNGFHADDCPEASDD